MGRAAIPQDEQVRLEELRSYGIMDTHAEKAFDDLAVVAAALFNVPIAYIGFVDENRQWMKSAIGLEDSEVPREHAFCSHVVAERQMIQVEDAREDERFVDNPFVVGDPSIRFYLGAPLTTALGNVIGTLCVVDDKPRTFEKEKLEALQVLAHQVMTQLDLRRANAILQEERETFSTLFEAAPVPLMLVKNGSIIRCNRTSATLSSDQTIDEFRGGEVVELFDPEPSVGNGPLEATLVVEHDRIPVIVDVTQIKLRAETFVLLAVRDQRERREKEAVLVEARQRAENATRIKDQFLSMVSHDLRSPLSGMFTVLDLLSRDASTFSEAERHQVFIDLKSSTAVLLEMINQLLNIHRLQSGTIELQKSEVAVRSVVNQIGLSLNRQLKEKGVNLSNEIPENADLVVDEGLFREVLFNLVSNAIKFSSAGSTITVSIEGTVICVADQGTGIPEDILPHLFDKMTRTTRKGTQGEAGTGLGLPLVHDIVEAHGGSVTVDSRPGEGTKLLVDMGDQRQHD